MMTFNCDDPESCGIVELDEFNVILNEREIKRKQRESGKWSCLYV